MKKVMHDVVDGLLKENNDARAAFDAMRERGLSKKQAREEIARAFLGCMFEVNKGMANRFATVLEKLREGRSASELFPDEFYK